MAVSGERRSWDTARSSAVFSASLRRSASASSTSLGQPLALLGQLAQRGERLLGLLGTPPRPGRELAHDDRGDEEDEEGEPVLGVLDRERVERLDEEEVEGEHAPDRRADGVDDPPGDRDRDDRQQVEHRQAEHGHMALEELDGAGDERERAGGGRDPGERSHPGNGTPRALLYPLVPATDEVAR